MKLYKNLNSVPVSNWNKIQESFISENPDLSPLIVMPKNNSSNFAKRSHEKLISKIENSKKYNEILYKTYLDFLYEMPEVDLSLNKKYAILKLKLTEFNANIEVNEYRKLKGLSKLKNIEYPVSKSFTEYINELNASYTDFDFKFNSIIENYAEEWERIFKTKIPKFLNDKFKDGFGFFLWEEFLFEIRTWEVGLMMIASTQRFQEIFIKQEIIQVTDLLEVNKRLEDDFKEHDQYNKWFAIRFDFFDMKKMIFRAEKQQTILSEVIGLSKILEQNIDIDNITIGQLHNNYRKQADKIVEANKPKK